MNEQSEAAPESPEAGESEAAPEFPDAEEEETGEPLYKRRWFKPIALIIALAAMLVLLGILFPPNYWRF